MAPRLAALAAGAALAVSLGGTAHASPAPAADAQGNQAGQLLVSKKGILTVLRADTGAVVRTYPKAYDGHWSPDGKRIVFSDATNYDGRIGVMNADGSGATMLPVPRVESTPDWSPDGKWVTYRACVNEWSPWVCDIYRIKATAPFGKPIKITNATGDPSGLCAGYEATTTATPSGRPAARSWRSCTAATTRGGSGATRR